MTHMYTTSHSRFPFLSLSLSPSLVSISELRGDPGRGVSRRNEGERGKKGNKKKAERWDRKKRGQSLDFRVFGGPPRRMRGDRASKRIGWQ